MKVAKVRVANWGVEGAQINKSLLALKESWPEFLRTKFMNSLLDPLRSAGFALSAQECIRAMGDPREAHVPFRASKLTLVLRDAFISRYPAKTATSRHLSLIFFGKDHLQVFPLKMAEPRWWLLAYHQVCPRQIIVWTPSDTAIAWRSVQVGRCWKLETKTKLADKWQEMPGARNGDSDAALHQSQPQHPW